MPFEDYSKNIMEDKCKEDSIMLWIWANSILETNRAKAIKLLRIKKKLQDKKAGKI